MTPRDALDLIKGKGQDEMVLWREPSGEYYLLAKSTQDNRYRAEGYQWQGTVSNMRKQLAEIPAEGITPRSELWQLMEDLNREEGR